MNIIEDGTGRGFKAKVNKNNQVLVFSESIPAEGVKSREERSFIVHAECHLSAAASGGLMIIKNTDQDNDIEITRIYIDSQTITSTDLIVTQSFDSIATGGTDVSATAIINKNRNSSVGLNATVKISDGAADLTLTSGEQYHSFPVESMKQYSRNMQQTNIIPSTKSIAFGFKTVGGGNATDGEVVSFSVNMVKIERNGDN